MRRNFVRKRHDGHLLLIARVRGPRRGPDRSRGIRMWGTRPTKESSNILEPLQWCRVYYPAHHAHQGRARRPRLSRKAAWVELRCASHSMDVKMRAGAN